MATILIFTRYPFVCLLFVDYAVLCCAVYSTAYQLHTHIIAIVRQQLVSLCGPRASPVRVHYWEPFQRQ